MDIVTVIDARDLFLKRRVARIMSGTVKREVPGDVVDIICRRQAELYAVREAPAVHYQGIGECDLATDRKAITESSGTPLNS